MPTGVKSRGRLIKDNVVELVVEELPDKVTKVQLSGRMDIEGAASVDLKMNALAGSRPILILDMAEVSFMASMGLRTLMLCGKAMARGRRKMAICSAQPNVERVLRSAGLDEVVPIYPTFEAALVAVG
jgi:anti-anti-sigma factor